jgi:hypothetical protein
MARMEHTDYGQAAVKAFLGDVESRDHVLPGGGQLDSAASYGAGEEVYTIKVNDADVNAGETSITVDALPVALPSGTQLNFSGTIAELTADAAAAATSITVTALTADIANDAEATYDAQADSRFVPAGTLLGRTTAEVLAGDPWGPYGDSDNEIYILLDEVDLEQSPDCNVVRHGSMIKYDFLPSWSASSSTAKAALHANYEIVKG